MPYRITLRGHEVAVDTVEELQSLLDAEDRARAALNAVEKKTGPYLQLYVKVDNNQKKFLRSLARANEGLSDSELRSVLNLQTNKALAGLTSGITKHASQFNLKNTEIFSREITTGRDGKTVYRYTVSALMKAAICEVDPESQSPQTAQIHVLPPQVKQAANSQEAEIDF